MAASTMWRSGRLVRTDVSDKTIASIFRMETIRELGTVAVTTSRILSTLKMETALSSEMSALRRSTRRHIPEDAWLGTTSLQQSVSVQCKTNFYPWTGKIRSKHVVCLYVSIYV
jgi:hypothetical protein